MNWLITGGCGFIGKAVIRDLLEQEGHQVRVFDNLAVGRRSDIEEIGSVQEVDDPAKWNKFSFVCGDVRDLDAVTTNAECSDVVVHLAANSSVIKSIEDPIWDCENNALGTLNTLEAARRAGASRFILASTSALLGFQEPPLSERTVPKPASPYGASKLAGEGYCSAYHHSFGLETVSLRFGNVYGEGSERQEAVIPQFIRAARVGIPLQIFGDGNQTRDFIHVADLARAIVSAGTTPGLACEVLQLASAREVTIIELVDMLTLALSKEGIRVPDIDKVAERKGEVRRFYSDTARAETLLNWRPKFDLESGLTRTVRAFLESFVDHDNT